MEKNINQFRDIPSGTRVPPDLCADLLDSAKPSTWKSGESRDSAEKEKGRATLEEAERIMESRNFIGQGALKKIYGTEPKEIPPILFSDSELR